MARTPKKTKAHIYGTVTFNDPLAATIFDRRATDFNTGLRDKDLLKCGSIIGRLYRESANGNESATAALRSLVEIINTNKAKLSETISLVSGLFVKLPAEKKLPSRASAAMNYEITWNNKMFLAILQLLQEFDVTRGQLMGLKDHQAIEPKQFSKLSKGLVSPLRSIIEQIFRTAKGVT